MPINRPNSWIIEDIGGGNFSLTNTVLKIASLTAAEAAVLTSAAAMPVLWTKATADSPIFKADSGNTLQIVAKTTSGSGAINAQLYGSNDGVTWNTEGTAATQTATTGGVGALIVITNRYALYKVTVATIPANCLITGFLWGNS